jgi:carbamoyl-phosphate synthase large subunit
MMVAWNEDEFVPFTYAAFRASPGFPVLIDRYLDRAIEVDVDVLCDGREVFIGGVMEHIEQAGIHSGDSACCTPPHTIPSGLVRRMEEAVSRIALALDVRGLLNVQAAVKDGEFYVIEINPRASRTVPYLSKATGVQLAKAAARIAAGQTLRDLGLTGRQVRLPWHAVKEAVLPFNRFAGTDPVLGPEMKSTGEVMGIDSTFEAAYWKSQIAAGQQLPDSGCVFLSARNPDKTWIVEIAAGFEQLGFSLVATGGTAAALRAAGLRTELVHKLGDGAHPTVLDLMREKRIQLVINTPSGTVTRVDEVKIRGEAILRDIPMVTTESGTRATLAAIRFMRGRVGEVRAIQDYVAEAKRLRASSSQDPA